MRCLTLAERGAVGGQVLVLFRRIRAPEEAGPVLEQALAHRGPVVVDVDSSLENLSAQNTISDLQAAE